MILLFKKKRHCLKFDFHVFWHFIIQKMACCSIKLEIKKRFDNSDVYKRHIFLTRMFFPSKLIKMILYLFKCLWQDILWLKFIIKIELNQRKLAVKSLINSLLIMIEKTSSLWCFLLSLKLNICVNNLYVCFID